MPYHFYLARCSDDTLYAGYCKDLNAREAMHNQGKGAKYTRSRRPVRIVYTETFESKEEAMRREATVKRFSRLQKEDLLSSRL